MSALAFLLSQAVPIWTAGRPNRHWLAAPHPSAPAPPSASAPWLWDGTPDSALLRLLVLFRQREDGQGKNGCWCCVQPPSLRELGRLVAQLTAPLQGARPRTASPRTTRHFSHHPCLLAPNRLRPTRPLEGLLSGFLRPPGWFLLPPNPPMIRNPSNVKY